MLREIERTLPLKEVRVTQSTNTLIGTCEQRQLFSKIEKLKNLENKNEVRNVGLTILSRCQDDYWSLAFLDCTIFPVLNADHNVLSLTLFIALPIQMNPHTTYELSACCTLCLSSSLGSCCRYAITTGWYCAVLAKCFSAATEIALVSSIAVEFFVRVSPNVATS